MSQSIAPGQSSDPLSVQVKQSDMSVVMGDANNTRGRDGQSVHRRVRPDGSQGRTHITQFPHLHRPIVRSWHHLIIPGEYRRGDTPKKLMFNEFHFTCQLNQSSRFQFDNYAKAYYDHILPSQLYTYSECPWNTETAGIWSLKSHNRNVLSEEEVTTSRCVGWAAAYVSSLSCPVRGTNGSLVSTSQSIAVRSQLAVIIWSPPGNQSAQD